MAAESSSQPRRRRPVAFFEPGAEGAASPIRVDKVVAQEILDNAQTIAPPSILATLIFALPFIALMIYLLAPPSAPPLTTTPLTPLLQSLAALTKLSPALPYTGLATHILLKTLGSTPNVPADLLKLAEEAKVEVEIFSGEEDLFRIGTTTQLEEYLSEEERTDAEMKEGYEAFFVGKEAEAGLLAKQAGELKTMLARLGSGLRGLGKEGEPAKIVEWVALVVEKSNGVFENIVKEAKKGRRGLKVPGKDWIGDAVLKKERREIKRYMQAEDKAGVVLDAIGKEYFEEKEKAAVENKLKTAISKGSLNWW